MSNFWGAVHGSIEGDFVFAKIDGDNTLCHYAGNATQLSLPKNYKGESYVIGESVFSGCTSLTSVTIPNSVTSIGDEAFYYCKSLIDITIPNSVTSIGSRAFRECYGLTSVTIGNSVTSIGDEAFYFCDGLTSVTIPNSVTSIGNYAFFRCINLYSVTIGNSVTSIGNDAFYECIRLHRVTIPNSVTSIGEWAFCKCRNLASVTIGNSVTSIGENAFYECEDLGVVINYSSLTIHKGSSNDGYVGRYADNVINAPKDSFEGDFAWAKIDGKNTLIAYIGDDTELTLPANYKGENYVIGSCAFYLCDSLRSITIPNSVTSIGIDAFSCCYNLTAVHISDLAAWCNIDFATYDSNPLFYAENLYLNGELIKDDLVIPDGVTSIGNGAFWLCRGLTSVTIPNSVTNIGGWAFCNCSNLTSVTIPNSVTSIGNYAFGGCFDLTSVTIPNSVTSIGESAFEACGLTSVTIPNSVISIGARAFHCGSLTSITIPNSVTSIGKDAFKGTAWYNNQPNGVVYAGKVLYKYKYEGRMPKTSINIKEGTLSIASSAFEDCDSLGIITIPNSVTSIGERAFYNCDYFESVIIGSGVTSIGDNAFSRARIAYIVINLSNLAISKGSSDYGGIGYYAGKVINAPNGSVEGDFVFDKIDGINTLVAYIGNDTELTLPANYKGENYVIGEKAFSGWSGLTSVTIPNSVTSIGSSAFSDCSGLTSVTIGNSVTSIGSSAFYRCYGLTSVTIGNSVTSIGSSAFYRCSGLTSVTIGNSVTSIGESAFYDCSGLTNVTIPNSVTSIGGSAFYRCYGLTNVTIPNSVTSIGENAFYYCRSLTNVTIGNSVTSIGKSAFERCIALKKVTIPTSVDSIAENAFNYGSALDTVVIASHEVFIGKGAFMKCDSLKAVYILSESVPEYYMESSSDNRPFMTGNRKSPSPRGTLYVPLGCKDKYPDPITKDFVEVVEMDMTALRQATGIATPVVDDDSVAINVENGKIIINGCNEGETISIYSMDGKLLRYIKADNNEELSINDLSGVIVVRIGTKAYKVNM